MTKELRDRLRLLLQSEAGLAALKEYLTGQYEEANERMIAQAVEAVYKPEVGVHAAYCHGARDVYTTVLQLLDNLSTKGI